MDRLDTLLSGVWLGGSDRLDTLLLGVWLGGWARLVILLLGVRLCGSAILISFWHPSQWQANELENDSTHQQNDSNLSLSRRMRLFANS